MSKLFSKLIGVNKTSGPQKMPLGCDINYNCSEGEATYKYISGKIVFDHCGCP